MAESFVERMRYLLSEIMSVGREDFGVDSAMIKKVVVSLEKFQSTLPGDELHRIRMLEDQSEAVLWMKELEEATYKMEDAVGKWRVKSARLDARLDRIRWSVGRLALRARWFFRLCCWTSASADASIALASAMESQVERLLLKGKKVVDKITESKDEDQAMLVPSVREDDRIRVLERLLSPDDENGQVVSIVGFGGSGKTTLARSIFNHHSVEQHFQVRVWVHASSVLDGIRMATKLLDSLQIQYPEEVDESGLELLLQLLQSSFSAKSVLAVFDDVWAGVEECSGSWEPFINKLFENSEVGSRILLTTRSGRGTVGIVHTLAPLSVEECKLIMKNAALPKSLNESTQKELVKRCEGSPLVAKILGVKLRSKSSFLVEVLDESIGEVCMVHFPDFYNTYENLPPHMKACLLFCANFPKSTVLHAEKIIMLWMSQGYLGYHTAGLSNNCCFNLLPYPDVERKGFECLSRLIDVSFLQGIISQSIHKPSSGIRLVCKMPDNVHDFVTCMAQAQHNGRRSLYFSPSVPVNPGLFEQIKRMTALVLSSCHLDQLPDEVRFLSRLQYLDLSNNPLKRLPPTICELYYLKFLDVHRCYLLSRLPENIEMLKEMRHLRMKQTTEELHDLPSGFEDLTLMRTLDIFSIGGKYKDAVITLQCLNDLVDICIAVHGEVHLPAAYLGYKENMVNLEMIFVGLGRNQETVTSIEEMEPPPNLEMLKFDHYPGLKLPMWINSLMKLQRLSLKSAANISSLPDLWKLSSLEFLWLYDMPKLKHLGCEFFGLANTPQQQLSLEAINEHNISDDEGEITVEDPFLDAEREEAAAFQSLKTLRIEYLENWETWEDANEADEVNIKVMPCLEELIIAHCPNLKRMPRRILKHTPWFENMGETHENNMKQPSDHQEYSSPPADNKNKGANVALEASYTKLKNFVHDAYMTKASAQPLKVAIPAGVLGKRMVRYLPLDSLHVWFEEDRSIFAEQMCVWSKLIYELMTPSDKERVQMASSALIKTVGRQEHSDMRAEDLVDFMMENKAKLYLVPFLSPGHWELLAINPETEVVYWFDSRQGNISPDLTEFIKLVNRKYITRNLNSTLAHDISWKVVDIKHKRQVYKWECGYYVMIWMQNIALKIQDLNLEPHFPTDETPYESDKLREVDWKWCSHVMPAFLA